MTYYKVLAKADQKTLYKPGNGPHIPNGWYLIGGELLTARECEKRNVPSACVEPVQVSKSRVYTMFGARFEAK